MKSKEAPLNQKGIPTAPFVDKIEDYVTSQEQVEPTLRQFQKLIAKYRFMEISFQRHTAGLLEKIPEMDKTLQMLRFLESKKENKEPFETYFELDDTLYAKAVIPPTNKADIWLGVKANVMIEYPIPEAIEFLLSKLASAKESLKQYEEDLEFVRENITTLEVNIARIYNWVYLIYNIKKKANMNNRM
uniref:Prefoldin subunit 3 n=1 Tax=Pneumocystis carinii TaxID=4754 RepID=Q6AHV2_PNECA|nr:prefoldin subnit (Prf), putative [Pneumocystis carinii]